MKNLTWQNPEQLFVAQELINKVKSKCCGIKDILYFMDFAIFDPRVFFSVFTLTLHAYIYKRVFNPSPFTFLFNILWVSELRVKGGEGR